MALALPSGVPMPREPKDEDYLVSSEESRVGSEDLIRADLILRNHTFRESRADLDELLTLKVSHSPWVVTDLMTWSKHLKDIRFLKDLGCRVNEDLHALAYEQWACSFGRKTLTLDVSKEAFFNNSVERYYDHDSVHAAVALGGEEGFKKILAEGSEVLTSRVKFEQLTDREKARLVYEEVMVLSLERDLIPAHRKTGTEPDKEAIYSSYSKQLRLLITQYSKGYFPRWIIENYFEVFRPPLNYWRLFEGSDKKKVL